MHVRETCRREVETPEREVETPERDLRVPLYLGSLEGYKLACPCAVVFPHSRPNKPLGHHLESGVDFGVAENAEGVKYLAS